MVYEQFLTAVKERMKAALGDDYELELRKVPKNNGLILDGLCITRGNTHIAPAIYLNPCYDQYREGMPLDQIVAELLALYRRNGTPPPLDYQMLSDYEGIRSHIACKLIHAASNEAILKDIPHILWMDLAIVFYLCIHEDDTGLMTAMIHNSHLRIWNISLEDLKTSALANSPRLFPPVISSMACIIEELNRQLNPHFQETGPRPETPAPFYVLSNRSGINGAACLLYDNQVFYGFDVHFLLFVHHRNHDTLQRLAHFDIDFTAQCQYHRSNILSHLHTRFQFSVYQCLITFRELGQVYRNHGVTTCNGNQICIQTVGIERSDRCHQPSHCFHCKLQWIR